jgi:predicted AAA+ superfamily ATPase
MKYIKRMTDDMLEKKIRLFGAVLITGAKFVGKSTSAKQFAKTVVEFQDTVKSAFYKFEIENSPQNILKGEKPILFDEWQDNYKIWDIIRNDIDKKGENSLYLLTGSTNENSDKVLHSGTGRIARLKMRPMTLYESADSNGEVSLKSLFEGKKDFFVKNETSLEKLTYLIVRGGFPKVIDKNEEDAIVIMNEYYDSLINEKVISIDGVAREPERMNSLLKSYARNISTYVSDSTIMNDMINEGIKISENTFANYKNALEKLFIIDNIKSWNVNLRSKTAIRKSAKKLLVDTSLVCASLGLNSQKIMQDFNYFGFLFEALCLRDLRIYVESLDGNIYNYREEKGFEIDAILELKDGSWGAVEIKLGISDIDMAAENLLKLKEKVDTNKKGEPAFLMVVYGGSTSYLRDDGVLVVPITCLKN